MKKKIFSRFRADFFIFISFGVSLFVNAQVPDTLLPTDPSEWKKFVNDPACPNIRDTFRLQTFSGSSADTWNYTAQGATERFNAAEEGIENQGGEVSFRLRPGSQIRFEPLKPDGYSDVRINFRYAAKELMPGENLLVSSTRSQNSLTDYPLCSVTSPHYTIAYPDAYGKNYGQIGRNPFDLTIRIAEGASTADGFYCLDSVYMHGLLPSYSLFTGVGAWETTGNWSHLPPSAYRTALINGKVTLNQSVVCQTLVIGKGSLLLPSGIALQVDDLSIYTSLTYQNSPSEGNRENYFLSAGSLQVNGTISVCRTFPQTDRWYFFSLPFDVYPEGLDPDFEWKDDKANAGGNYFYLRQYNGRKRAANQTNQGNWEIIRPDALSEGEPVFYKNRGYLIALDALANRRQLRFTSKKGDIPKDFGQKGTLSVQVYASADGTNGTHAGWNLCGNPFPASLPLSSLAPQASTDGYIYVYDGQTYQPYALGSDYMLPPFTAFFIKATQNATLSWQINPQSITKQKQIPTPPAFRTMSTEPQPSGATTVSVLYPFVSSPIVTLAGNLLQLENMPTEVTVCLNDSQGHLLYNRKWPAGDSIIPLPPTQGVCFLTIETQGYRRCYKYRLE